MPDLKRAIRALEVCTSGVQSDLDCTDCPYHDDCESHPMRPMMEMLNDCLSLLKDRKAESFSLGDIVNTFEETLEEFHHKKRLESPRLLTLEEIEQAPDFALLYEEVRLDWRDCDEPPEDGVEVEYKIGPVEKRGNMLYSLTAGVYIINEVTENICKGMFGKPGKWRRMRFWSGRPTDEQREATPWE